MKTLDQKHTSTNWKITMIIILLKCTRMSRTAIKFCLPKHYYEEKKLYKSTSYIFLSHNFW